MATANQINFIADLATAAFPGQPDMLAKYVFDASALTNAQVSSRINFLKGLKRAAQAAAPKAPIKQVPEGTYLALGKVVKVKISKKSQAPYLISAEGEYLGALKGDAPALLDAIAADPKGCAIAYGKATGNCCICGKTLTNPDSIAAGIGPICGGKF